MAPLSVALAVTEEVQNETVFRATTVARDRFVEGDLFRGDLLRALGGMVVYVDTDGDDCGWVTELVREAAREEAREKLWENPHELLELSEANEVSDEALLEEIVRSLSEETGDAKHMTEFVLNVVEEEGCVVDGGEKVFRGMFPKVPLIVVEI